MFSTFDRLHAGPLGNLEDRGPFSSARFSTGPDAYYYTVKRTLYRRKYWESEPESLFTAAGPLDYPLYTSAGIFVSQVSPHRLYLVDEETGAEKFARSGSGEQLMICDIHPSDPAE